MDIRLGAAHIRKNTVRFDHRLQPFQIHGIGSNRRTQENTVAGRKLAVHRGTGNVHGSLVGSFNQRIRSPHISHNLNFRMKGFDRFGNRAADQSQTYKSYGFYLHSILL